MTYFMLTSLVVAAYTIGAIVGSHDNDKRAMETRRLAIKKENESRALESCNSELREQVSRMYDYNNEVRSFCSELYGMLGDYVCPRCPYECPGIDDPSTCKVDQRMSELDIETRERKRIYPFDCGMVTYDGENVEWEFDE